MSVITRFEPVKPGNVARNCNKSATEPINTLLVSFSCSKYPLKLVCKIKCYSLSHSDMATVTYFIATWLASYSYIRS